MNIALMAHDRKKELMVQFCIAYCGILAEHSLCATHVTGKLVSEATGLPITLYLHADQGGSQQIGARISFNEIDLVLFFCDPANPGGFDATSTGATSSIPSGAELSPLIAFQTAVRMSMACGFAFLLSRRKELLLWQKLRRARSPALWSFCPGSSSSLSA